MAFEGRIGHLEGIESPWGNAGGVVKTVRDVELMARTGVGWIEAGSYTLEPREGNGSHGEKVYHHAHGSTFNSLGMPNEGMDEVETQIPEMIEIAHAHHKPLVVNVAPVTDKPAEESVELVRRAYAAGADAVLLNAGCPNVVTEDGGRHELLSCNPIELGRVLVELTLQGIERPLFVRTSPQASVDDTLRLGAVMRMTGNVSAVFTPNTWPVRIPKTGRGPMLDVPGDTCGMSGPSVADAAYDQTVWMTEALQGNGVDVVSSSGIMTAGELQARLDLGAVAGAGTTFYFESQNWQGDTDRLLSDLVS
jgi:dihydroorotate dehydrogenase